MSTLVSQPYVAYILVSMLVLQEKSNLRGVEQDNRPPISDKLRVSSLRINLMDPWLILTLKDFFCRAFL
jgi:hypothetical protein